MPVYSFPRVLSQSHGILDIRRLQPMCPFLEIGKGQSDPFTDDILRSCPLEPALQIYATDARFGMCGVKVATHVKNVSATQYAAPFCEPARSEVLRVLGLKQDRGYKASNEPFTKTMTRMPSMDQQKLQRDLNLYPRQTRSHVKPQLSIASLYVLTCGIWKYIVPDFTRSGPSFIVRDSSANSKRRRKTYSHIP